MGRGKGVVDIRPMEMFYKSLPCKHYVASVYCGKISC